MKLLFKTTLNEESIYCALHSLVWVLLNLSWTEKQKKLPSYNQVADKAIAWNPP